MLTKFSIDLPDSPLRYTSVPDALGKDGIWGGAGINSANVAMSATETITTNARVLGADPLVKDGFGEEDMLTLVLPYIKTAREGVLRLGELLETYGTYESNGIAFADCTCPLPYTCPCGLPWHRATIRARPADGQTPHR